MFQGQRLLYCRAPRIPLLTPQGSSKLVGLVIMSYDRSVTGSDAGHSSIGINAVHKSQQIMVDQSNSPQITLDLFVPITYHFNKHCTNLIGFYARDPETSI